MTKRQTSRAEIAHMFVFGVKERAQLVPASETAIRDSLVDADGQPTKASVLQDGKAWLRLYGQRVPVHLHGAKHQIVFFRRDLEAAFGELFHVTAL